MAFTALILVLIISFRKQWQKILWKDLRRVYLIGFIFAVHWVAFYMSIKLAGASIAVVCLSTASIFTAFVNPLYFKTKIARNELVFSLVAILGVLILYLFQKEQAAAALSIIIFG